MDKQRDLLSTREAAELLRVGPSTVKRWADEGALQCIKTRGGHRRFVRAEVERLLGLQEVQQARRHAGVSHWVELLLSSRPAEAVVARLMHERARLRSWWQTADYLGGVLDEVGERWQRGELTVLDEHVISERFARGVAWAAQTIPVRRGAPRCLLAMAEGDDHTLGLSLAELTVREAGFEALWAGRRGPVEELVQWVAHRPIDVLALSASRFATDAKGLRDMLDRLAKAAEASRVVIAVGGQGQWPTQHPTAHRLQSFGDLHRLLVSLRRRRSPQPEFP